MSVRYVSVTLELILSQIVHGMDDQYMPKHGLGSITYTLRSKAF